MNTAQKWFALAVAFAGLLVLTMVIVPVTSDRHVYDDCGQLWTAIGGGPYKGIPSSETACKSAGGSRLAAMAMVALLLGGSGLAGMFIFRPKTP